MSLATTPIKLTYEDYLEFPDDGNRHELIEGDHVVTPAPNIRHQRVVGELFACLRAFVQAESCGEVLLAPTDVVLSEHEVIQPDLLFVTREHLDGPPDLIVEVISETTRRRDEVLKRHLYDRRGVAEYWLVDPVVEAVKLFRRTAEGRFQRHAELTLEAGDSLSSPLLPGLEIPLDEMFA